MTPTIQIINHLSNLGVTIWAEGESLIVTPKSRVPADLVRELPQRKPELMALLTKMCFCLPPMPPAGIDSPACQHCGIACWCATCGGCRWCAFEVMWKDNLEPKYRWGNGRSNLELG
jgi:hypothetical protein